ncbi:YoaK family protein [Parachitinimonas caeni]|uniref:YoaK family protein n=1 Tax=Parachitinimonas caeni TaxID=3031301 RepID=A0ABT7E1N0_9NEIS|nr:YoaK family protein [Parachitinimonas caeni]MDK2126206.1 YoaK family protein [Parachitinimonas caeni]
MPLGYLRNLSSAERTTRANQHLGLSLAFVAGAINAGGFLAVGQYTSHMTGVLSAAADHFALGELVLGLAAMVALLTFILGAASTAILINWARRRHLRSQYALSLLLEACLLLIFGLAGANLPMAAHVMVPTTVLLLCFVMGLQNAIITKISQAEIRTTHITGMATDIGIEAGKWLYRWRASAASDVAVNFRRLSLHLQLLASFFLGGLLGATGFKYLGYSASIPLAAWLVLLAMMPILDDLRSARTPSLH